MWHHICQGLVVAILVWRFVMAVHIAAKGREETKPTEGYGIFLAVVVYAAFGIIFWKAGAFDTIIPY